MGKKIYTKQDIYVGFLFCGKYDDSYENPCKIIRFDNENITYNWVGFEKGHTIDLKSLLRWLSNGDWIEIGQKELSYTLF